MRECFLQASPMMTMVVASGGHVQASTSSVVIWLSYAGMSDWLNVITDSSNKYTKPVISLHPY